MLLLGGMLHVANLFVGGDNISVLVNTKGYKTYFHFNFTFFKKFFPKKVKLKSFFSM